MFEIRTDLRTQTPEVFANNKYMGELAQEVDGLYVWWPGELNGHLDERFLGWLYEQLRHRNAPWRKQLEKLNG